MRETNIKTTTYKIYIPEEFYIDITETNDMYESWIYQEPVVFKLYMFGAPKKQQTKEEYKELVEKNIPEYAIQYCCEINEWENRYEENEELDNTN